MRFSPESERECNHDSGQMELRSGEHKRYDIFMEI
jgi:hypothetical protein